MKKYVVFLFAILMCFSLVACNKSESNYDDDSVAVATSAKYKVTYYGDKIFDTDLNYNIELNGAADVPIKQSKIMKLSKNVKYSVSFDYIVEAGNNRFNVDLYPDTLPQKSFVAKTTKQHANWVVSTNNADISNCRLRFFDDLKDSNEKDIRISNIIMGTIKEVSIKSGSTLGTLPTPKRNGYIFLGWYTSPNGGKQVTSSTKVTSNLSLYPRFSLVYENSYDYTVSTINVLDYGADETGNKDSTDAFNKALSDANKCKSGGCGVKSSGVVFVPAGTYKITGQLSVPARVALIGVLKEGTTTGTVLKLYYGKNQTNSKNSAIKVANQGSVKNMAFWYPEQTITANKAIEYPPTIIQTGVEGLTLENLVFVNSYIAMDFATDHGNISLQYLKDIYGTPLYTGIVSSTNLDTLKIENLKFGSSYWLNSKLSNVPSSDVLNKYLINSTTKPTGLLFKRLDWYLISNVSVSGYYSGIKFAQENSVNGYTGTSEGEMFDVKLTDCYYPIYIEKSQHMAITSASLKSKGGSALYIADGANTDISINSSTLSSTGAYSINTANIGNMTITNSTVTGKIRNVKSTSKIGLVGNSLKNTGYESKNQSSNNRKVTSVSYNKKVVTKPTSNQVIVISAKDNEEISKKLNSAISNLSNGGIVYIPAGKYYVNSTINVKTGVEIRGAITWAHNGGGTIIQSSYYTGPLFTLQKGAGINGLTISYQQLSNPYNSSNKNYVIQGRGSNIYIMNTAILNAWKGIDLESYRCDNHYVRHIWGSFLENGISIGGGSTNGIVRDCHLTTNVLSSSNVEAYKKNYTYTLEHEIAFSIGNTTNQILLNNFVWGSSIGYNIKDGANKVTTIGCGADYSNKALNFSGVINNSQFINMLLVTKPTNKITPRDGISVTLSIKPTDNHYIESSTSYNGFINIINSISWGNSDASAYLLKGKGDIHINGGIIDNASKPVIQNGVLSLSVFGTIINPKNNGEIKIVSGAKNAAFYCPICKDGSCNFNNTSKIKYGYNKC